MLSHFANATFHKIALNFLFSTTFFFSISFAAYSFFDKYTKNKERNRGEKGIKKMSEAGGGR